jgi:hypothetical protein
VENFIISKSFYQFLLSAAPIILQAETFFEEFCIDVSQGGFLRSYSGIRMVCEYSTATLILKCGVMSSQSDNKSED